MGVDGRHDASLKKIVHEDRCVGLVVYEREREREKYTPRWEVGRAPLMVSVGCIAGSFRLSLGKAIARSKYSLAINIGS